MNGELEAIFALRAESLARNDVSTAGRIGTPLLAFSHGQIQFAVELSVVSRVVGGKVLTALPKAPAHLDHVFYEGGRIISALNPSALLGESAAVRGPEVILLLEAGGTRLGIRATQVSGTRAMDLGALGPVSPALDANVATCIRGIGDDLTVVFDGATLISALRAKRRDVS